MKALTSNSVEQLLYKWTLDQEIRDQIVSMVVQDEKTGVTGIFPQELDQDLKNALEKNDIKSLYTHQLSAYDHLNTGNNVVIVTGTASGKSLCYNLPILNALLRDPRKTALYLFPTKALTQDQYQKLNLLLGKIPSNRIIPAVAMYDGDTPSETRRKIRENARIIFSNPDMLHTGIMPYHMLWDRFFSGLSYVVLDEAHYYRGVFGSHIANLIRRMKRLFNHYQSNPQFILTSATIANPLEFSEKLIGAPFSLIDEDGSPKGKRYFLMYNPPVIDEKLGIRKSVNAETQLLAKDILNKDAQSIFFMRTRKSVEVLYKELKTRFPLYSPHIYSYRSGYLPSERRKIEKDIRERRSKVTISTNALELGIDIGGLDVILILGYPGTISATKQQAGRAGRQGGISAAVLLASSNPQDQYLVKHPEYFYQKPIENALINPDNLLILLEHLQCSVFELPFNEDDSFGDLRYSQLRPILEYLTQTKTIHYSSGKYIWISSQYPSQAVSLRSSDARRIALIVDELGKQKMIGDIDYSSSLWMVHPQAVYFHAGDTYEVQDLDLENNKAILILTQNEDYFTEPINSMKIDLINLLSSETIKAGHRRYGEIQVISKVTGYKIRDWRTKSVSSIIPLDMPETTLNTTGCWFSISNQVIETLKRQGLWNNDQQDYGRDWTKLRKKILDRDNHTCQHCGMHEDTIPFHVHHLIPIRNFDDIMVANRSDNLVTLCPECHKQGEMAVKIRSSLAGLGYALQHIASLLLMCDVNDIGKYHEINSNLADGDPIILLYDQVAGGIGLSKTIYDLYNDLFVKTYELVSQCSCEDGCPSCIGASSDFSNGSKAMVLELLRMLIGAHD